MAVDASSVSVVLGASSFGPGVVVTSAGIVFAQAASAPGATSDAYWYYNGTNLVGNVPTGKGYALGVNGSAVLSLGTTGDITAANGTTTAWQILTAGAGSLKISNSSGTELIWSTNRVIVDGSAVTLRGNAGGNVATAGAAAATPTGLGGQLSSAHIAGGSTSLSLNTCRIGLGAGTTSSGTAVTASGHDLAGRVGVTINSTGTANQPILLVSFAAAYNTPPFVALTPGNAAAAALAVNVKPHVVTTTSGFAIMGAATGITTGASYVWYYSAVIQ